MNAAASIGKEYSIEEFTDHTINPLRVIVDSAPVVISFIYRDRINKKGNRAMILGINMTIISWLLTAACLVGNPIYLYRTAMYFSSILCVVFPWMLKTCLPDSRYKNIIIFAIFALYTAVFVINFPGGFAFFWGFCKTRTVIRVIQIGRGKNMIPKVIHYCWFGRNPLPKSAKKCIKSWKTFCPDYEIKEWNEDNFDINSNRYVREAYETGKFAFVSDCARLYALYNYGGIYMDTDVEVLKSFNDILDNKCVFGFEEGSYIATSFMAAEKKANIIKEFIELYENETFKHTTGKLNTITNVVRLTELLKSKGLVCNDKMQNIESAVIYPKEYFSPYDYRNCVNNSTSKSYCIHWYYVSWMSWTERLKKVVKKTISSSIGIDALAMLRRFGGKIR